MTYRGPSRSLRRKPSNAWLAAALVVGLLAFRNDVQSRVAKYGPRVTMSVRDFGARGDGVTDDRAAIQSAIDALAARRGGVLRVPRGTYLLDSYKPAAHPWGFYNLLVGSHIHIEGEDGATLLQGKHGRAPLPPGATMVMNSVLVVGIPRYAVVTCQDMSFNGGFYPLCATVAGTTSATLDQQADTKHFAAGDYIVIYERTDGDVLPSELTRIAALGSGGQLSLASPLARSFATPSVANVTKLITSDVRLKHLQIQGAVPLTVMETYGFAAEDCEILADASVNGSNAVTALNCNTMRSFRFVRNLIGFVGPWHGGIELPQRNSQDGLLQENTIRAASVGFGEYGAHWLFLRNHLWLYPQPDTAVAVSISGLDVLFSGNDVHCAKLTGGEGWGCVLTDFYAPGDYAPYVGRVRIQDNTIECEPGAAYGLLLRTRDPVVSGNRIQVRGAGTAIRIDGDHMSASIVKNDIRVEQGAGIMLETGIHDASTIESNRTTGTNGGVAVHVARRSKSGKPRIERNVFSGFARGIEWGAGN